MSLSIRANDLEQISRGALAKLPPSFVDHFINLRKYFKPGHQWWEDYKNNPNKYNFLGHYRPDAKKANLIGSMSVVDESRHYPGIDFDFPAWVIPSNTPGHCHLHISKSVTWDQYKILLRAFVEAGLIETGFVELGVIRRQTTLRVPGLKKGDVLDDLSFTQ